MNNIVVVRKCKEYDITKVSEYISNIYKACHGPELKNKKVLVKPNILLDDVPEKCISTHPVVVEAMIRFLQSEGATVFVGDSPAIHMKGFNPLKSGIAGAVEKTGAVWVDFTANPSSLELRNGHIRIASIINEVDLIISLPKLKNHELVYFTGGIKNTLGLVPGFSKTKQHALHQNREEFCRFLVDLNEAVTPDFILMDGIMGMDGRGPGQGNPVGTEVLIGSTNPLALDIIAGTIAGYKAVDLPLNRIGLQRGNWLKSVNEIEYDGPELGSLIKNDFVRIPPSAISNISLKFLRNRLGFLRKLDRRPVFNPKKCAACGECIRICPQAAIKADSVRKNHVVLTDRKCIRCFCCSEVCKHHAVDIRVKIFGV